MEKRIMKIQRTQRMLRLLAVSISLITIILFPKNMSAEAKAKSFSVNAKYKTVSSVTFSWKKLSRTSRIKIHRAKVAFIDGVPKVSFKLVKTLSGTKKQFTDKKLQANELYMYRIRGLSAADKILYQTYKCVFTGPYHPDWTGDPEGDCDWSKDSIKLVFNSNGDQLDYKKKAYTVTYMDVTAFDIQRRDLTAGEDDFMTIGTVKADNIGIITYEDTSVKPLREYEYRLVSRGRIGKKTIVSAASSAVSFRTVNSGFAGQFAFNGYLEEEDKYLYTLQSDVYNGIYEFPALLTGDGSSMGTDALYLKAESINKDGEWEDIRDTFNIEPGETVQIKVKAEIKSEDSTKTQFPDDLPVNTEILPHVFCIGRRGTIPYELKINLSTGEITSVKDTNYTK